MFKIQIYYWEIFSRYLSDFPKIRENKSREKYFLFLTAKINPREKIVKRHTLSVPVMCLCQYNITNFISSYQRAAVYPSKVILS